MPRYPPLPTAASVGGSIDACVWPVYGQRSAKARVSPGRVLQEISVRDEGQAISVQRPGVYRFD